MSWRDALVLAGRGVVRRFGRSALTVLGVGLAAALLMALLTIATTAETRVLTELAKGGPLAGIEVSAAAPVAGQVDRDEPRAGPPRRLDDMAVRRISELPDVVSVVPIVTSRVLAVPLDPGVEPFVETVVGVDLRRASQLPISILEGRLPATGSATEVAVTEGYLERLDVPAISGERVIGSELELGTPRAFPELGDDQIRGRWTRVVIVGVVAQEAGSGQFLAPIETVRAARAWTLSGGNADQFGITDSPYAGLFVVARGLDQVGPVRDRITDIGYSTSAPENLIATVRRYLRVVEIVLAGIGAIALLIASLGIASALLAAVRERRREIGVLKAIGARDRDVLRVFLMEASALGFVGGALGVVAGWLIASMVGWFVNDYLREQGLAGVRLGLSMPIVAGAVVGSTLLALAAGTLPARRAARLPAREAIGGL